MVNYQPAQASTPITATAATYQTAITVVAPATVVQDEPFTASSLLTYRRRGQTLPLAGMTVTFSYDSTIIGSAVTGPDGSCLVELYIPQEGSFTLTASFAGAAGLSASSASVAVATAIVSGGLAIAVIAGVTLFGLLYVRSRIR